MFIDQELYTPFQRLERLRAFYKALIYRFYINKLQTNMASLFYIIQIIFFRDTFVRHEKEIHTMPTLSKVLRQKLNDINSEVHAEHTRTTCHKRTCW